MTSMEKSRLPEAVSYMREAHKGQTRWDGRPYEVHPTKVVQILRDMGIEDEQILVAGYLHDVIEDTPITRLDIKRKFGEEVADLVEELTFKEGLTDIGYQLQCAQMSNGAQIIKIADILANISDKGKKSEHFLQKRTVAMILMIKRLLK